MLRANGASESQRRKSRQPADTCRGGHQQRDETKPDQAEDDACAAIAIGDEPKGDEAEDDAKPAALEWKKHQ